MFRSNLISAPVTRRAVGKFVESHFVMSFLLCNEMSGMSVILTRPRKQQPQRLLPRAGLASLVLPEKHTNARCTATDAIGTTK